MSKLKDLLQMEDLESALLTADFDRLFHKWNDAKGPRSGLHASSIVAADSEFCYREQVMSDRYIKAIPQLGSRTLKIFLHGWYVHIKWQSLFEQTGIARSVEKTHKSGLWRVFMTPDAVITMHNRLYVVEIKSMNTHIFKRLTGPPINAVRQVQFYMHMLGIPNGIVLVEDKNDQEYKLWAVKYDVDIARPFVERLHTIQKLEQEYTRSGRLPKRICKALSDKRAQQCPLRDACFADPEERESTWRHK